MWVVYRRSSGTANRGCSPATRRRRSPPRSCASATITTSLAASPPARDRSSKSASRFPPWLPRPSAFTRALSRGQNARSRARRTVRPADRQLPERLHLPLASRPLGGPPAIVLSGMRDADRLVRPPSARELRNAAAPLPLL